MVLPPPYQILEITPPPDVYCDIRLRCNLSPRSLKVAADALPKSLYAVSIVHGKSIIGMGRIIGDSCFLTVTDICVLPEYQGQGLGKVIMDKMMKYVKENATGGCDVNLMAVGDAKHLYEKYGFFATAPTGTIAMRYLIQQQA